jgi:hypothetical protein
MNELTLTAKFLFAVGVVVLGLSATHSIGFWTKKMAEAAISAQQHDQMSYGKFSRELWREPANGKK